MKLVCIHERDELEAFLRRDTYLHLYELGDLDELHWRHTLWFALSDGDGCKAVALLYTGLSMPTLLVLDSDLEAAAELTNRVLPLLPARVYAHLRLGASERLSRQYTVRTHGRHLKLALQDDSRIPNEREEKAAELGQGDAAELLAFYEGSYPGHFFERDMLSRCPHMGLREAGRLVAVAGVHVFSSRYRVAALGNIAVRPDRRGRGLGRIVTAALCGRLRDQLDHIGLNVRADNDAAVRAYSAVGFVPVGEYEECEAAHL